MKNNLYDLFSGYDGELPEIQEKACDFDKIAQLVNQKRGKTIIRRKKRIALVSVVAVAMLAVSSVTVVASGKLDLFHSILSKTKLSDGGDSLPLMQEESEPQNMEQYLAENTVHFNGSESIDISTVCMYHDVNTLMLTLRLQLQEGITIPTDALFIPYFDIEGEQLNQSGCGAAEPLVFDEEENCYYVTYYLVKPEISGQKLHVVLENAYTPEQLSNVQQGIISAQEQWHKEYGADNMTVDEWKELWQRETLDERTRQTVYQLLQESDRILTGTWEAELEIPQDTSKQLTIDADDGQHLVLNDLSVLYKHQTTPEEYDVLLITTEDGTVLYPDMSTNEENWFAEQGIAFSDNCKKFAYSRGIDKGNIYSFDKPYPVDTIQKIEVYHFAYEIGENDWTLNAIPETLYEKES